MEKYIKQLKKQVIAVLIAVMAASAFAPVQVLAESTQSWQDAYAEILLRYSGDSFAIHDMDRDGIPELFIRTIGEYFYYVISIYTFRNGRIYDLGISSNAAAISEERVISVPSDENIHGVFIRENYPSRGLSGSVLLTIRNGELYSQTVYHSDFHYTLDGIATYFHTVFAVENNIVAREYSSIIELDYETGESRTRQDNGFDEAYARLASTPLEFHTVTLADIAMHILGSTANNAPHPFAIELQNIINNLPVGHTFESATLINLDQHGEQQGVAVLTTPPSAFYPQVTILFMHNGQIRTAVVNEVDISTPLLGGYPLPLVFVAFTPYNMLFSNNGVSGTDVRTVIGVQNGNLQLHILTSSFEMDMDAPLFYSSVHGEITEQRHNELERELGLTGLFAPDSSLPDQTAQILAMQAPTTPIVPPTVAPVTPVTTPTAQPNAITVTIGNTPVNFADQLPTIVDGRTLVPVRGVFEALDFDVSWNEELRQVTLSRANDTIIIIIGSAAFTTNGINHTLDVPAQSINGRTMLPIRAVLESVGYDLAWDESTQTVIISTS